MLVKTLRMLPTEGRPRSHTLARLTLVSLCTPPSHCGSLHPQPQIPHAAEIAVSDIVDYAQRISGITSAPSYWKPGMAMVGFAPPAPRPEMMRAGALSAFAVTTGRLVGCCRALRARKARRTMGFLLSTWCWQGFDICVLWRESERFLVAAKPSVAEYLESSSSS